jgi:hypothetical protein
MSIRQKLTQLTQQYGIAWFIVNQILGWISFIAILLVLRYTTFDLVTYLQRFPFTSSLKSIPPSMGNFAVAFIVNRVGTPVRIVLTTALMPYCADSLNTTVNPLLERFGLPTLYTATHDFPGVEEEDKKTK